MYYISKYVKKFVYDDNNIILYNYYNGAIYLLSSADYATLDKNSKHYEILKDEKILVEVENVPEQIRKNDFVSLTIEVSNICNLQCSYCYEKDKNSRHKISTIVMGQIGMFIENIFRTDKGVKALGVRFIGGEPLIEKNIVLKLCRRISALGETYQRKVNFVIDTNGTIPFKDVYEQVDNLKMAISLTLKKDHNKNRSGKGFDSFERIIANLGEVEKREKNTIEIRYNTNNENIDDFEEFVKYMRCHFAICEKIKPMYTDEYSYNDFKNYLSLERFMKWNSSVAIDILIKYQYPIDYSLGGELTICDSYQKYSCKIYMDGMTTICDAMFHDKASINIAEFYDNLDVLEQHFKKYRMYNPMEDNDCKDCIYVAKCMGKLFCRGNACEYEKRFNDETLVKTYVKYFLEGKENVFINM